ncbi:MAG: zinc ribbon domain-containing protein [Phycisphaerales bacterium]|nr:zinc ribbon domain-containing protein [Planctomycetota bacterium]MCH8507882.1 zinc ribbon domain-containing protein [Phycisphaerales bacterium]
MPTYEYRCKACGHEFEEFQSITAKPLKKCPSCTKLRLERLIGTGSAVMFKGGGFYETDYRSDSYKKAAKADADAAKPKTESSDSGKKTDAKPDHKPDTKTPAKKPESKPAKSGAKD